MDSGGVKEGEGLRMKEIDKRQIRDLVTIAMDKNNDKNDDWQVTIKNIIKITEALFEKKN